MKIADLELEIVAPGDLESQVHALTGASAAEVRRLLDGPVIAGFVAKALHPFLADAHELADLARKIAEHGVDAVKAAVAKLFDEASCAAGDDQAAVSQSVDVPSAGPNEPTDGDPFPGAGGGGSAQIFNGTEDDDADAPASTEEKKEEPDD